MYNVLIVDDEQYALDGMMGSVHWEQLGFNSPFTALGVASAKQVLTENIIDIMLCDIEMPGESGLNLLKWIQENQLATVCILVTCHEEFDYAREAIQLRAFDYLVKPVYARKLEEVLQKAKNELKKTGKSTSSMIRQEGSLNSRLIRKICLYIEEHVTEDLTRQSVAGHFSLNPDHLNRIFKAEINKTILDYIIECRINLAKKLLRETDLSVTQISETLGYSNYSYFARIFRESTGIKPNVYRRQKKE